MKGSHHLRWKARRHTHTHTPKQDHRITKAPNISHLLHADLQKVLFYLLSTKCLVVRVRRDVCCLQVSVFARACLLHVLFNVADKTRQQKRKGKETRPRLHFVLPLSNPRSPSLAVCAYVDTFRSLLPHLWSFPPPSLPLFKMTLQLRSLWGQTKATITQTG